MAVNSVTTYNNAMIRLAELKKIEDRHNAELVEVRRAKEIREDTEQKRIEMNRRMNRPGQNVDRMA